ncbi:MULTISPECIES: YbdK family carboxylate-amine ligase [Actinosynnema]|uniref:carboxylate-amine ligase n=1 Tax=Actinosynnema TaxID=40566 RepID=UPI0027E24811|nr:YbdK family carboxylate-amine ligase [Actinosynnema pretiosum]MCP2099492.1 carboxylate-amine ligase [Actinosynnema pretiosum]
MTATTFGVEEEYLLVSPETWLPTASAPEVLAGVRDLPPGALAQPELLSSQVEFATGVCRSVPELRAQLRAGRAAIADAADRAGVRPVATGNPPLFNRVPVTRGSRYRGITDLYRAQLADYQCCGCHVHVGVPDRDTGVAVLDHLRPWLPTLLALSVNSPFDRGEDTGHGSWRAVRQSSFPGWGVQPVLRTAARHDRLVDAAVGAGVLVDATMTFWLARLSPKYPTVEVRAADTAATAEGAVVQAVLTRALVDTALAALERGEEAGDHEQAVLAAALWSAARHGTAGWGVDPVTGRAVRAEGLVRALLAHVREALGADAGWVTDLALHGRSGAALQRGAGGGATGAVRALAEVFTASGS